jgi:hypothetical protein
MVPDLDHLFIGPAATLLRERRDLPTGPYRFRIRIEKSALKRIKPPCKLKAQALH